MALTRQQAEAAEAATDLQREAYVNLAEELDADPDFLADADEFAVKLASTFARRHELPWKPTAAGVARVAREDLR